MRRFLLLAATIATGGLIALNVPVPVAPLAPRAGPPLTSVAAWGYQLQNVDASLVPPEVDMLVVDYSRDGTAGRVLTAADVGALRLRPDGSRRIVLCYLSIGEAENYRFYWNPGWAARAPDWLGSENASWKGNFAVKYWQPEWQQLIVNPDALKQTWLDRLSGMLAAGTKPYLDQIIEAGFDGVFLDRVDAFEPVQAGNPNAKSAMIDFIETISSYSKARRPGFIVVSQNGEQLLADPRMRAAVDGVAKEDLFFGETGDGVSNTPTETRQTIALLNRAKSDGRPVFVIEYLSDPERQRRAAESLHSLGYIGLFAERGLKSPPAVTPLLSFHETTTGPNMR